MKRSFALTAIVCPLLGLACSSSIEENVVGSDQATTVAESSYVSDAVLATLNQWPGMRGQTWNVTHDNTFAPDFLRNTPMQPLWGQSVSQLVVPAACTSNCDPDFGLQRCATQSDCTGGGTCAQVAASVKSAGQTPVSMCVGHSDALVDEMYRLIVSAQQFVDITSLLPADGRFEAMIRNAITVLSQRATPPEVRMITGDYPVQGVVNSTTVLKSLTRDVKSTSNIRVAFGNFRSSDLPPSWNHAKMIAVDGREAIVGGHNLWTKHYLGMNPVNDLSMHLHGSAAADAHRFANVLWSYTCNNMSWLTWTTWSVWENQYENGSITSHCPKPFALSITEGAPVGTVISVGRLGTGIASDGNQADAARVAMMASAKTAIRLSQQDIGPAKAPILGIPLGSWPDAEIGAMADAMNRGVDVYIVLSNPGAVAGGLSSSEAPYSNGWSLVDVGNYFKSYMQSRAAYPHDAALRTLLCNKLHIAPLTYGPDASWPDGNVFANHAKTIEVDAQAFYVGSQNLYPAGLQEFGYIVDDSRATATWLGGYWQNVWTYSHARAISGDGEATCQL